MNEKLSEKPIHLLGVSRPRDVYFLPRQELASCLQEMSIITAE